MSLEISLHLVRFCLIQGDEPDEPDKCSPWLRVLHLAARCMLRVFRSLTEQEPGGPRITTSKRSKHRKQTDVFPSSNYSVTQPLLDLPTVGSRLVILHDWWPVLINMYVLSLRKRWLYQVAADQVSLFFAVFLLFVVLQFVWHLRFFVVRRSVLCVQLKVPSPPLLITSAQYSRLLT